MKNRVVFLSKDNAEKWFAIANAFAKSLCPFSTALQQFNGLSAADRKRIKRLFEECDSIRRKKIPEKEKEDAWVLTVMVDAHIIATEYNIDPLAVVLSLNAPCKYGERIIVK